MSGALARRNPSGAGWRAKGFRAGVSGRYSESSDAWNAAAGKPPRQVPGGFGAPAESGKYITAHEYFLEGFNRGAEAREKRRGNPAGYPMPKRTRRRIVRAGHVTPRAGQELKQWSERAAARFQKRAGGPKRGAKLPNAGRPAYYVVEGSRVKSGPYPSKGRAAAVAGTGARVLTYAQAKQLERAGKLTGASNWSGWTNPAPRSRGGRIVIPRSILQKYKYLFGGKISPAALKLIRKEYGRIKNPGAGAFERCVKEVAARGQAYSPRGVCATAGRKKYGAKKFAKMAAAGKRRAARKRPNPEEAAAERYEFFHGRAPAEVIDVTTQIHEHGVLSGIGKLQALVISAVDGSGEVTLSKFRGALLAQNEAGTQLFIEGGDQSVRVSDFIGRRAAHETETLGPVLEVEYSTQKDHLRPEDGGKGNYHHKFGKRGTLLPLMIYDVVNKLLKFSGGGYDLPEVGIRG